VILLRLTTALLFWNFLFRICLFLNLHI
jgi:hypothetical protein